MNADNLKRNGWPKKLSNIKDSNYFIEQLKLIAERNKGKLLSKEWKGFKFKYLFCLTNGIKFERSYEIIKKNGWPKNQ